jgi:DNA-binding cell septation regulator SpoVG
VIPARPSESELCRGEAATWGARLDTQPNRTNRRATARQARLRKWTPYASGALLGFLSVEVASGLILNDLRLMTGKNGHWIATPAVKLVDRDGNPRVDAAGKPIFNQIVEFRDRATTEKFNGLVIELLRAAHPDAFSG